MASLNRFTGMGNLVEKPKMVKTTNGTSLADFRMAFNHIYTDGQGNKQTEAMFIDVVAFGKQAEILEKYCDKGRSLYVEGRLAQDTWDDKETGKKRSKIKVVLETFQFLDSNGKGKTTENNVNVKVDEEAFDTL